MFIGKAFQGKQSLQSFNEARFLTCSTSWGLLERRPAITVFHSLFNEASSSSSIL